VEGAGVRLHRAFGTYEVPQFDPFLLLDDFRARRPEDYLAGFPDHPHRGIETVTCMLEGTIEHRDSLGNAGSIGAGDVQWMTAGSGIIHSEMPGPVEGRMGGFQVWINLPREHKMTNPRYCQIPAARIPTVSPQAGIAIRVISGSVNNAAGPVTETFCDVQFLDVSLGPDTFFTHAVKEGYTAVAYVTGGEGTFDKEEGHRVRNLDTVLFSNGTSIWARSSDKGMRFLFLAGRPVGEPVAWRGAIVMNTREELRQAYREYADGTFVRNPS
jgi:redox-sensitive bicupin YhaK (pirin superfamily)